MAPTETPVAPDAPWLARYPAYVPKTLEVPSIRLPDLVEPSVGTFADRTAFVYYGTRLSYREFWDATGRVAAALAADGFVPGDRLALYLPNTPAHPIAFFAALRLGLTVVHVSPLYLGQDLVKVLADSQPKGLVTLEILYPNLAKVESEIRVPVVYVARTREFYPIPKRWFVNAVLRRQGRSTAVPSAPNRRDRPGQTNIRPIDPFGPNRHDRPGRTKSTRWTRSDQIGAMDPISAITQ